MSERIPEEPAIRPPRAGSKLSSRGPALFRKTEDREALQAPVSPTEYRRIGLRVLVVLAAFGVIARWGTDDSGAGLLLAVGGAIAVMCGIDLFYIPRETDAARIFTSSKRQAMLLRVLGIALGAGMAAIGIVKTL